MRLYEIERDGWCERFTTWDAFKAAVYAPSWPAGEVTVTNTEVPPDGASRTWQVVIPDVSMVARRHREMCYADDVVTPPG